LVRLGSGEALGVLGAGTEAGDVLMSALLLSSDRELSIRLGHLAFDGGDLTRQPGCRVD
jgi:hypothetical protein